MEQVIKENLHLHQLSKLFPEQVQQEMQLESLSGVERLFSQGDDSQTIYLLIEGKLKISMLSPEGKRLILAFKSSFDLVGDTEYVQQCPLINTVEAVTAIQVI